MFGIFCCERIFVKGWGELFNVLVVVEGRGGGEGRGREGEGGVEKKGKERKGK